MNKLMALSIMVLGLFLASHSASYAVTPVALNGNLNGNAYEVVTFCRNDAGEYCTKGDNKNDVFRFEDKKFIVDSFDDGLFGAGDSGEFNEYRLAFTANYEVITEDTLDKYTFDVKGMNLIDTIIFGQMDVAYYKLSLSGSYDKQDETTAFFFGKKSKN